MVTGAAGFIGSHLTDRLLSQGDHVIACDNLASGRWENLAHNASNPNFEFVQLDLLDINKLTSTVENCRTIYHLAAHADVRTGASDTRIDLENGIIATYNVLEAARLNHIDDIVYASSAAVYGESEGVAVVEDVSPLKPISLYGAAKVAAEALIQAYCNSFGIRGWIFRFANIIGQRRRQGVVFDFVKRLHENPACLNVLGDGSQCKPYLHVSDCIEGILFGYQLADDMLNLFNLGTDSVTSVRQIAAIVTELMELKSVQINFGSSDRGWPGDAPQLRFDTSRLAMLGWFADMTSDEAIKKAALEHIAEFQSCK